MLEKVRTDRDTGLGKESDHPSMEVDGFSVVEEAATDLIALAQAQGIAEPWTHPSFIDAVFKLQRQRQVRASRQPEEIQFHDRSTVCTAALGAYLGHPISDGFAREPERIKKEAIYRTQVFS
jgi:predicted ATPase